MNVKKYIRVVGLDDQDDFQYRIRKTLTKVGSENFEIYEEPEPLLMDFTEHTHIAIIDQHLGGAITGIEVMREIHKLNHSCRVIMITGNKSVQLAIDMYDAGAFRVQVKEDSNFDDRLEKNVQMAFDEIDTEINTWKKYLERVQKLKIMEHAESGNME